MDEDISRKQSIAIMASEVASSTKVVASPEWGLDESTDIGEMSLPEGRHLSPQVRAEPEAHDESPKPASTEESAPAKVTQTDNGVIPAQELHDGLRFIHPNADNIYSALEKLGLIDISLAVPESYRNGTPLQQSIFHLDHINPAGIAQVQHRTCRFMTTKCRFARFIAILYELTSGDMSFERIESISVENFHAVYNIFNHMPEIWFSMYACYINACAHVRTFRHPCSPYCIVAADRYHLPAGDDMLRAQVAHHMLIHYHQGSPRGNAGRGIRGRPNVGAPRGTRVVQQQSPAVAAAAPREVPVNASGSAPSSANFGSRARVNDSARGRGRGRGGMRVTIQRRPSPATLQEISPNDP